LLERDFSISGKFNLLANNVSLDDLGGFAGVRSTLMNRARIRTGHIRKVDDLINDVHALNNLSPNSVLLIEEARICVHDEELAARGIDIVTTARR
jgi:hypothetical protein